MHRFVVVALFVFACCTSARAQEVRAVALDFTPLGGAARANASSAMAPIDASFGPYPMSIFGIENAIRRYDGTPRLHDGPLAYAVLAIRDWESRFPRDPSIARDLLSIQRAYEHSASDEGLALARRVAAWVQADYPATEFARLSKSELAKFATP